MIFNFFSIRPGDFVIPNQIIDRTKSIRQHTYFAPGQGLVAHAMFGEPFTQTLSAFIAPLIKQVLPQGVDLHTNKGEDDCTVVCMEGPQFSTRAESRMYRQLGGDIINMSVLPEAKLAREAELRLVFKKIHRIMLIIDDISATPLFAHQLIMMLGE